MAATKQVKILQLGPKPKVEVKHKPKPGALPRPGGKRAASIEVREPLTTHPTAGESIDSAAVLRRFPAAELAYDVVQKGYKVQKHGGLWKLIFNRPVTETDIYNVLVKTAALLGKTEADVQATGASRPGPKVKIGRMSMLGDTSKMGCYSFNLPAGPKDLLGACPAADPGFMFLRPEQRTTAQRGMRVSIPIHVGNYICNGCYAIKGSYGNPNQTVHQQIKFFITQQWLAAPSTDKRYSNYFVEQMVKFVQLAQQKSLNRRKKISKSRWWQTPHPSYFRLHDAGDFYTPEYARSWFEVVRALPNILFWAPTRMWIMKGMASTVFAHGVPDNLALRPSALHFGEMPPEVYAPGTPDAMVLDLRAPGLSAPSGAAKIMPPGVWECPAMLHKTEGGGAVPKLITEGPKTGQPQLDKEGKPQLVNGMCARAHGPNSPLRGGKDKEDTPNQGGGCRVCWRNRALPVFYHEH